MVTTYFVVCRINKEKMFCYVNFSKIHLFLIFLWFCFEEVRGPPKDGIIENIEKGRVWIIDKRMEVRCKVCNQRLFDYMTGDFLIEIKCSRCKTVNLLQVRKDTRRNKKYLIRLSV